MDPTLKLICVAMIINAGAVLLGIALSVGFSERQEEQDD